MRLFSQRCVECKKVVLRQCPLSSCRTTRLRFSNLVGPLHPRLKRGAVLVGLYISSGVALSYAEDPRGCDVGFRISGFTFYCRG